MGLRAEIIADIKRLNAEKILAEREEGNLLPIKNLLLEIKQIANRYNHPSQFKITLAHLGSEIIEKMEKAIKCEVNLKKDELKCRGLKLHNYGIFGSKVSGPYSKIRNMILASKKSDIGMADKILLAEHCILKEILRDLRWCRVSVSSQASELASVGLFSAGASVPIHYIASVKQHCLSPESINKILANLDELILISKRQTAMLSMLEDEEVILAKGKRRLAANYLAPSEDRRMDRLVQGSYTTHA